MSKKKKLKQQDDINKQAEDLIDRYGHGEIITEICKDHTIQNMSKTIKDLEAQVASLNILIGKWITQEGLACPSCVRPFE